jgi:hypothetical protein
MRAHIDESSRSRVMASGNWPVKFCPLRSLQECALTVGCTGCKKRGKERTHMLVILPMHRRSPSAAGTVPTSMGGVLADLAEPALLGAVIAHPSGGHDAQLHVHGAPEAVSKVTASTAPAAAVGPCHWDACTAYGMGTGDVRTADGRRGCGRRPSRCGRRRHGRRRRSCTSAAGVTAL